MQSLREIPKFEAIRARVRRYPEVDPGPVETCLILLRVAADATAAIEAYLNRHGMSHGRLTVMAALKGEPATPLSPSELAEQCGVSRATMTGLINGLERDKLVKRDHPPGDRRTVKVRLTAEGTRYLDSIMPQYYRRLGRLMGHLTESERTALQEMSAKINAGLGGVAAL